MNKFTKIIGVVILINLFFALPFLLPKSNYEEVEGFQKFVCNPIPKSTKNIEIKEQYWPMLSDGSIHFKFKILPEDFKNVLSFRNYKNTVSNPSFETSYTYDCKDGSSIMVLSFNHEDNVANLRFRGFDNESF